MKLKALKYIFPLILISTNSFALDEQEVKKSAYTYDITVDKNTSSKSSADFAISVIEGYRLLDDRVFAQYDHIAARVVRGFARFLFTSYIHVGLHEIGGHGARAREFDIDVTDYKVSIGSGSTYIAKLPKYITQEAALDTGGMQASHIAAEKLKSRFIESGSINPTYGIAYFHMQVDQPEYILGTKYGERDGHDVALYIKNVNQLYGVKHISKSKVRSRAWLDLLDPFLYYSLYAFFTDSDFDIPMFEFGDVKYLPATRAVLAPYGLESRLVNHFKYDQDKYARLSISYGKNKKFKTYSVSLLTNELLKFGDFSIGTDSAIWSQPKAISNNIMQEKTKLGGMFNLNCSLRMNQQFSFLASVGYKTDGFIEGEPLKKSGLLRFGLRLNL